MDLIKSKTPEMNPVIVNGIATHSLPYALEYIDKIFKWAYSTMEMSCGVSYDSYELCTPKEEFEESSRPRGSRRSINVGESSIFMVKFFFSYRGEKLPPKYVYLPFVEDAGSMYLGGSRYFVFPVLSNKVISSTSGGLFVKMLKDKSNFGRIYHNVIMNGEIKHGGVITSPLYRKDLGKSNIPITTKAEATCLHYILSKYGLKTMFQKFYGFCPVIGTSKTINTATHPSENFTIFESVRVKPKSSMETGYVATDMVFAVPNNLVNHELVNTFATLFYIIDNFPDRLNVDSVDRPLIWILTLGHINFSGVYNESDIYEKMKEHFVSLDDYMDDLLKEKLAATGYVCFDTYDLLFYIKRDFAIWHTKGDVISSMYGKELDILENTLSYLVHRIFKSSYEIRKKINSKKELSKNEIIDILNIWITTGAIFKLTRTDNKSSRSNISTLAYSGDNKFFKITSTIIPQEGRKSNRSGARVSLDDPNNKLHASYAECGGYLAITGAQPIGNGKLNPYTLLDNTNTIMRNPEFEDLINKTQKKILSQ
jgi:hypothetical protein